MTATSTAPPHSTATAELETLLSSLGPAHGRAAHEPGDDLGLLGGGLNRTDTSATSGSTASTTSSTTSPRSTTNGK
jgi:hypothetical protein